MARPTKFTDDRKVRILTALRTSGCSLRAAAAAGGVGEDTLGDWLTKGRRSLTGPYRSFFLEVQQAIADSEATLAAKVAAAADKDWRAAAWLLERRFPHLYAPQINLVRHFQKLSDAELEAYIQEEFAALRGGPGHPTPALTTGAGGEGEPGEDPVDVTFSVDPGL